MYSDNFPVFTGDLYMNFELDVFPNDPFAHSTTVGFQDITLEYSVFPQLYREQVP